MRTALSGGARQHMGFSRGWTGDGALNGEDRRRVPAPTT
jgi:hypothetical protein